MAYGQETAPATRQAPPQQGVSARYSSRDQRSWKPGATTASAQVARLEFQYLGTIDNGTQQVYVRLMLRKISIYLDSTDLKRLAAVAKKMTPGTKTAMLIRQAISEFLVQNEKEPKQ